ncbi:hypothetical protein SNEBB_004915 [Seison nebaliae]|nr:hypothetical protein SNEBB_004915 [Seison nebaliae]
MEGERHMSQVEQTGETDKPLPPDVQKYVDKLSKSGQKNVVIIDIQDQEMTDSNIRNIMQQVGPKSGFNYIVTNGVKTMLVQTTGDDESTSENNNNNNNNGGMDDVEGSNINDPISSTTNQIGSGKNMIPGKNGFLDTENIPSGNILRDSGSNNFDDYKNYPRKYNDNFPNNKIQTKIYRNCGIQCNPRTQSKLIECRHLKRDVNLQTSNSINTDNWRVLPLPVPYNVPVPMAMYTTHTPVAMFIPVPVPVPIFLPTSVKSSKKIQEDIQLAAYKSIHPAKRCQFYKDVIQQMVTPRQSDLQFQYGVEQFHDFLSSNEETKDFKDFITLSDVELNVYLREFVEYITTTEAPPSGEYLFFLLIGIQYYLVENNRALNIFQDEIFKEFQLTFDKHLKKHQSKNIITEKKCRITEKNLFDARMLGAHTPATLLFTLIYLNTKHFFVQTALDHSFITRQQLVLNVRNHYPRGQPNHLFNTFSLRFFPTTKPTDLGKHNIPNGYVLLLEVTENLGKPQQCPVRLHEFYAQKCPNFPPEISNEQNSYYLKPANLELPSTGIERYDDGLPEESIPNDIQMDHNRLVSDGINMNVVSEEKWFENVPLELERIDGMMRQILYVNEIQYSLFQAKTSDLLYGHDVSRNRYLEKLHDERNK